ncbi:lipopolysaccharide biosynthesis protein [uncultured Paraglaciecola sp.]|uniref:lipopolysaccharide biosynthesis protein n=1 Tax=uncultured Paraglaciecola sp. TaxID=1765024 RepID=UPI00259AB9CC|nr:lipopolysaccharide biosynthesis protein [uncultured Paraglaciecola sp.]
MIKIIKEKLWNAELRKLRNPILVFLVLPFTVFAIYQLLVASPRYESQAQFIVKEPNSTSTLDPALAIMSGFGVSSSNSDVELVKAFIYSNDMLNYLEESIQISQHYSDRAYDVFSRLESDATKESKLEYYLSRVKVEIDEKSQVIALYAQAFDQNTAHQLNAAIVDRAEWYINNIGQNLAKEQLKFVQQEHELVMAKLQVAKSQLLDFQRRYNLLDPEAEGIALQQITYQLESEIASKTSALRVLRGSMSEDAPMALQAKAELDSLKKQLKVERERLTNQSSSQSNDIEQVEILGVGEILAKFTDYKINLELTLQAYTASQISLEKSRIEAYKQLKYLIVVEAPTLPEDNTYPKVIYNLALFLAILFMFFGITKIVLATVEELR